MANRPPKPHWVDAFVGKRIRALRKAKHVSLEVLAKGIDISHQQIQKYEGGTNRITVSRLWDIAVALDTPLSEFLPNKNDAP